MPVSFIDSNVLLYIASDNETKAAKAEAIIAAGGAISVQVLNELANVARRKMQMSWVETNAFLDSLRELLTIHPLTLQTHKTGLAIAERYRLSVNDSMIAAAALHAECDILWSEDMHDGLLINDSLRVVNPFRATG